MSADLYKFPNARNSIRICPECGYRVSQEVIERARINRECAGCGIKRWSDYTITANYKH